MGRDGVHSSSPQLLPVIYYLDYSCLSNSISFSILLFQIFFPGILSWAVSLKQLTLIHFQPIVRHSFVCAFLTIFSPKASHVRRTVHCWSCIFSTENTPCFPCWQKGRCVAFSHSRSLLVVLPQLISQEGRGLKYLVQVLTLLFSLQYLISFQKYMKQSDWHLSHLCTFLLCPGEEVCAKEHLGFEPVYFKLDFPNAGFMYVISPPQTLPHHLLTFNLTSQRDNGPQDKMPWQGPGRRERDEYLLSLISGRICSSISFLFRWRDLGSRTPTVVSKENFVEHLIDICGSPFS